MDALIGREAEVEILNDLYDSGSSEMVAIYGRRRVGKTFLVSEVFKGRLTFVHSGLSPIDQVKGTNSRMKAQLRHFRDSLVLQGSEDKSILDSWLDAFFRLELFLQSKDDGSRQVVFLDEIQWMDTPRSCFMTGLEAFWNSWACFRDNIMLIICGSSTSWVLNKVIHNHGGLYGRVTRQIHLMPFDLSQCEQFLESHHMGLSRYDVVQVYMALGGIPYYLRYLDPKLSFPQNMDALFFKDGAPLRDEFDQLFSSAFAKPEAMKKIVRVLEARRRGFTRDEIIQRSGIPEGGDLSKHLKALIESGFITMYIGFGENRNTRLYKLIDPFCLFYLGFKEGDMDSSGWADKTGSPSIAAWRGLAFENVCFNHVPQIKKALGISGVATRESLWSKRGDGEDSGTQIDMIIERKDNIVDICEAKFLSDPFPIDKEYHFVLERRKRLVAENVPKKMTVRNVLICTFGLKKTEYRWDFAAVVTIDDLFER